MNLCISSRSVLLFSEVGCPDLYFLFELKLSHIYWDSNVAYFCLLSRCVQPELNGQIVSTEGGSWECLQHTGHPGVAGWEGCFFFLDLFIHRMMKKLHQLCGLLQFFLWSEVNFLLKLGCKTKYQYLCNLTCQSKLLKYVYIFLKN